ncbi:MAG: isoprenyl transferase [Bacteroidales bacterium]|nr:isoprenyl transferase [Bacteroidales bacterium]
MDEKHIPRHVAVVMDGNGRWAQKQKQKRIFGHQHAMTAVRETVEAGTELGVKYITLYTFSTENWNRPKEEVDGIMELLVRTIQSETPQLKKNGVRLEVIGDMGRLPELSREKLQGCMAETSGNDRLVLVLALSYSSRWEIGEAIRKMIAAGVKPEEIDEESIRPYLTTKDYPDPDLLIRTGGELRLSNFLLWQMAYTEFYFTEKLWPDFRKEDFRAAVEAFQGRQRRFGKTGEQK